MAKLHLKLLCGVAFGVCLAGSAQAQTASAATAESDQAADSGDIIVTAQKRDERLQDVPISITAASAEQLARQGITAPADLARIVPGFTYQESSYSAPVFTIRGIGLYDTSVGIAPTVTVYVDQVPLPYLVMTSGATLDLERVEVLKGPQGTIFGQNSTGGAINYIAAKPTSDTRMGFDLTYGRFNQVDAQGFVSGALSDTLRVRVAARHEYRDGWQISETRPSDRLGSRDFTSGRALIDWEPSDRFKFEFAASGWIDHSETRASQFLLLRQTRPGGYPDSTIALAGRAPAPDSPRIADWDADADLSRDDNMYQLSGRGDYQLNDQLTLTSISAYTKYKALTPTDADGTNYRDFLALITADIKSIFQEVRLAGEFGDTHVTAGVNYQDDTTNEVRNGRSRSSNQGVGPFRWTSFDNVANQRVHTYAGFVSVDSKLAETLTVHAGLRYTKQTRDFSGCLRDPGDGTLARAFSLVTGVIVPNGACATINQATGIQGLITSPLDQDNLSWRAGVDWRPDPSLMLYANVTKGYKAGAYSPLPAIFSGQLTPVTQESVLAYEGGVKASPLGRVLDLSAAIFYYKYNDKQILGTGLFPPFGALPQLVNVPKSNVLGGELEITLRPVRGLRLSGGATYVRSRVDSHFNTPDPFGAFHDIKGESFPNTPRWQLLGAASYDFALSSDLKMSLSMDASHRGKSNAVFGENPIFKLKSYTLVGARIGIGSADDKLRVELWGQNIFNTFYWLNVSRNIDAVSRVAGMPATYGVTLRTRF